ncbi:hypothetical protein D3C87_1795850 [compost metagenome]
MKKSIVFLAASTRIAKAATGRPLCRNTGRNRVPFCAQRISMARLYWAMSSVLAPLRCAHLVFQKPSRMSMSRAKVSSLDAAMSYSSPASTLRSQRRIFCLLLALSFVR